MTPVPRAKWRVLVVEDEARLRDLLVGELPDMGFDAEGCRTAEAAERVMSERPADIIMLDLNLPVMDGMTFLDRLRRNHPHVAVIICTGFGSLEAAQRAIHHEVVAFLSKPFHLGQIEAALDRARKKIEASRIPETRPLPVLDGGDDEVDTKQGKHETPTTIADAEREMILEALRKHEGNRSAAAAALGISRRTLYNKLEEYEKAGLWRPDDL